MSPKNADAKKNTLPPVSAAVATPVLLVAAGYGVAAKYLGAAAAPEAPVLPDRETFRALVAVTVYLVALVTLKGFLTAGLRLATLALPTPEDYGFFSVPLAKAGDGKSLELRVSESVERVRRAHRNDLESVPFFLALVVALAFAGVPAASFRFYCASYSLFRTLHTALYLGSLPGRPFVWAVSWVFVYGAAFHALIAAELL